MLGRDDELRLSAPVQARYAAVGDSSEAKARITHAVQLQVVREAGFAGRGAEREGLELLRSALALFPGDAEIVAAAFYLRNNTHVRCPLPIGSCAPLGLRLACAASERTLSLNELVSRADLTILCAGSGT